MKMKPIRTLRRGGHPVIAGCAVLAVLLAAWTLSPGSLRFTLRERVLDLLLPLVLRAAATDPGVVVVDIDRVALARFGPWPWPRGRMAELVAAVAAERPSVIGIDILFAGSDRFSPDGDTALAQALSQAPSVLGFVLDTTSAGDELPPTPLLSRGPVALPDIWRANGVVGPPPALADVAQGLGALVAAADLDGPIRRVPLLVLADRAIRPGLAVEAVRLAQGAGTLLLNPGPALIAGNLVLPLTGDAALRLRGSVVAPTIPASRLMEQPEARSAVAGRIVLIGSSAPEAGGLRVTPASPATPSVLIQAEAIETILRGQVLVRPDWAGGAELAAAALLGLCCLLLVARLRPAKAALCALLICLAWTATSAAAIPGVNLLLDPAGPPLVALVTFGLATLARFVRDEWRARLLRLSFEQHLAPELVRRIATDPTVLRLQGEMREITALFTDIEGFTSMTERAEPAELVALLDTYFDSVTRIITDHGGMIDKIVGDAVHAIFNAPFELTDHPRRAVDSALALLDATEGVRRSLLGQRLRLGRTRIGIETGPAIVGDVGGSRKLDYTAHGNAINAAARLEAANKDLGSAICIGPGTAARLDPASLRQIGTIVIRGQSGSVPVYTPASLAS
jgi:adenylate cyclase